MKKVAIIGLGWVGMPLAFELIMRGFQVIGTKTTEDGVEAAKMSGLECHLLNISVELTEEMGVLEILSAVDVLVITLPVRKTFTSTGQYVRAVHLLVESAKIYGIRRVIFLSSISVYGELVGIINEQSPLLAQSDSGKTLAALELWMHALPGVDVDVLRLAGLVGPKRHPGRFLSGKNNVAGGEQNINLVYQGDVIAAICLLIERSNGNRTYNLCAPNHPIKREYYHKLSMEIGAIPPLFMEQQAPVSTSKIIDGNAICHDLGFVYRYPDPWFFPR